LRRDNYQVMETPPTLQLILARAQAFALADVASHVDVRHLTRATEPAAEAAPPASLQHALPFTDAAARVLRVAAELARRAQVEQPQAGVVPYIPIAAALQAGQRPLS
jgi:hypothetical protein